ncbi:hypothetical protein JCM6882_006901 [Rhodosporidiobolus microsporus]
MPKPDLAAGFEWQPTFDELLEQTATSNVVDADWSILKDMIKYKLAEAISSFLAMGPPWPLAPEDALQARIRAYDTLDSFGGAPFTIQRLCELSLHPRTSYTSLPKYLRAVNRVLSVTSERSAFTEDDSHALPLASTSAGGMDAALGVVSQGVVMSPAHHTGRRGSAPSTPRATPPSSPSPFNAATSRPSASPAPSPSPAVVPLLSPIPWLTRTSAPSSPSAESIEPFSLGSPPPSSSLPLDPSSSPRLRTAPLPLAPLAPGSATDPTVSPPKKAHHETRTPTGGVVDEVDPGSGTGETAEPVALTHAAEGEGLGVVGLSPPKTGEAGKGLSPADLLGRTGGEKEEPTSLQERFVRASRMDDDAPTESVYRSTLHLLAQRLLPSSIATLPSHLLALASALLSPSLAEELPWAHQERDTDFWDAGNPVAVAVAEWDGEGGKMIEGEKLEMGREDVEGVREARRGYFERVKEAEREEEQGWMGRLEAWPSLPRLRDDYLLPRSSRCSTSSSNSLEAGAKPLLLALIGPSPAKLFPKPDERLKEMDAMGDVEEAMDVKLALSEDDIAFIKGKRAEFKRVKEEQGREVELGEGGVVEAFPRPPSPRLGSPPLFPRSTSLSLTVPSLDAFVGGVGLTSEMSNLPSPPSPGGAGGAGEGAGVGMGEWNRAGEVWSSSAPSSLAPSGRADEYQLAQDDEEIDQLDSDSDGENDFKRLGGRAPLLDQGSVGGVQGLFASDDTMGDAVGETERGIRLRIPRLPSAPSLLPPAPSIPPLSAFSSTTSNAPPTTYSLTPLSGLRSLSISLSWDICASAADDRSVREFVNEEDGKGEKEVCGELKRGAREVRRGWEEGRERWEEEEEEAEGKEEGWPKAEVRGEEEVELRARAPLESRRTEEGVGEEEVDAAGGVEEGMEPGKEEQVVRAPAPPPSPTAAVQPASVRPIDAFLGSVNHRDTSGPPTSSSDFGFVFPEPSSPPAATFLPRAPPRAPPLGLRLPSPLGTNHTSPTAHVAPPSAPDFLVLRCPSLLPQTEKAISPAEDSPRWSNGAALDRFLLARGRGQTLLTKRPAPEKQGQEGAAKKPSLAQAGPARSPHSSPPPGSIPFTIPPFLASSGAPSRAVQRQRSSPLRVVAFSALLQMRPHFVALQQQGFELVHRSSSSSTSSQETAPEPHLTVAPATGVLFVKLVSLLGGGAVPPANKDDPAVLEPDGTKPPRPEPLLTTLSRLTRTTHDRLLVLLEEPTVRVGGVRPYAYTPPVLSALRDLAGGLSQLERERGGRTSAEVALSKGEGHSAELVRGWCGWLEAEERKLRESGYGGLPALDVWGERAWLADDPSEDELSLLHLATGDNALDPLIAAAVVGTCSLNDLSGMDEDDRVAVLEGLVGEERADRLSALFSAFSTTTLTHIQNSGDSPLSGDAPSLFVPFSAMGGSSSDGAFQEQFEAAFDFEKYDAEAGVRRV